MCELWKSEPAASSEYIYCSHCKIQFRNKRFPIFCCVTSFRNWSWVICCETATKSEDPNQTSILARLPQKLKAPSFQDSKTRLKYVWFCWSTPKLSACKENLCLITSVIGSTSPKSQTSHEKKNLVPSESCQTLNAWPMELCARLCVFCLVCGQRSLCASHALHPSICGFQFVAGPHVLSQAQHENIHKGSAFWSWEKSLSSWLKHEQKGARSSHKKKLLEPSKTERALVTP